ncbi:hypothetical protein HON01_06700 [Candidatus Woesearchaeota archaeon]|jgi:hypothetical protein|nr:hypothetical protein [Candidatus Woesearchaeota archaeon]MBT7367869.1 hypothetical protein [Candidatus Woesearchaeota archaeon]
MIPKFKKTIERFLSDQSGSGSKKSIVFMGILAFALSSHPVRAGAVWAWFDHSLGDLEGGSEHLSDGESWKLSKVKPRCIAIDPTKTAKNGKTTLTFSVLHWRGCDSDHETSFTIPVKVEDLIRAGAVNNSGDLDVLVGLKNDKTFNFEFSDHISHSSTWDCCDTEDHFSSDLVNDPFVDQPKELFFHKNDIALDLEDNEVLVSKHTHDVLKQDVDLTAHLSNHWSQSNEPNICDCSTAYSKIMKESLFTSANCEQVLELGDISNYKI